MKYMSDKRVTAILLAAGKGTRMGGSVRKQYMELDGRPLLSYSLETLEKSRVITDIVVVVPDGEADYVAENIVKPVEEAGGRVRKFVSGGAERCDSVRCGIEAIDWPCDYVFIHDGARPFISEETLQHLYDDVMKNGASVAAVPSKDTVKISDDSGFVKATPERRNVWIIQTPQCFEFELAKDAYEKVTAGPGITDDAMVIEKMTGHKVKLTLSDYRNIKVTTPEDIEVARSFVLSGGSE